MEIGTKLDTSELKLLTHGAKRKKVMSGTVVSEYVRSFGPALDFSCVKVVGENILHKTKGEYVEIVKVTEAIKTSTELTCKLQQLHSVLLTTGDILVGGAIAISKEVLVEVLIKEVRTLTNKLTSLSK